MAECVQMKKEDYETICNFIRTTLNTTDPIKSGELLAKVEACIEASGGNENLLNEVLSQNVTKITKSDLSGITNIGSYAFYRCRNLSSVAIPNTVSMIDMDAFSETALTSIVIPSSVRYIGPQAFYGCSSLSNVVLSEGLENMSGSSIFYGTLLTTITLPSTLTNIDAYSLNCNTLTTINVPWAEGEVANAPWGATNATINYNYTGE